MLLDLLLGLLLHTLADIGVQRGFICLLCLGIAGKNFFDDFRFKLLQLLAGFNNGRGGFG